MKKLLLVFTLICCFFNLLFTNVSTAVLFKDISDDTSLCSDPKSVALDDAKTPFLNSGYSEQGEQLLTVEEFLSLTAVRE